MNKYKIYSDVFDESFKEIGVDDSLPEEIGEYNRYPQMLPWVGAKYETCKVKILLIGESHYLPDEADDDLKTPEGWYYQDNIDSESYSWTNTREIVNLGPNKWNNSHNLYREVNKIIANSLNVNPKSANFFEYVSYYNYFLRPAFPKGNSFKKICKEQDLKISFNAFNDIVNIIKPDLIYFVSKFAWESMKKEKLNTFSAKIDFSPHPASPWWNMKKYYLENNTTILTGREKFSAFLKKNNAFE